MYGQRPENLKDFVLASNLNKEYRNKIVGKTHKTFIFSKAVSLYKITLFVHPCTTAQLCLDTVTIPTNLRLCDLGRPHPRYETEGVREKVGYRDFPHFYHGNLFMVNKNLPRHAFDFQHD